MYAMRHNSIGASWTQVKQIMITSFDRMQLMIIFEHMAEIAW